MNRKLLLFCIGAFQFVNAQFTVSPNPFNANSGVLNITYGASGDFSLFNPMGATTIYLYTGLETDGVTGTWDYHDTWTDINSLVPLNLQSNGSYTGTVNIGARNYFSELTMSVGQAPAATTVNNWYFIIRNASGNSQSSDLLGTNYGFVPGVLSATSFDVNQNLKIFNNQIESTYTEDINAQILDLNGKTIKTIRIEKQNTTFLDLVSKQVYVLVFEINGQKVSKKFIN